MEYSANVRLKDGRICKLRNGTESDAKAALDVFILTHEQTDNLLTYPDEFSMTKADEAKFLKEKRDSEKEIELVAEIDGKIVGMAGIEQVGKTEKTKSRAEFGVSINKEYWRLGIGRALTKACIECAKNAGFYQIELSVVADNEAAISLYKSEGFKEYGRNPRGFLSRFSGWQELVLMRLELD